IYLSPTTNELKQVKLSSSVIQAEVPRSMTFNSNECAFYVITSSSLNPKLYKIDILGNVTPIGNLSNSAGFTFYRCESIAYNNVNNTTYISASKGPNNYTPYIFTIDLKNAICTEITEVNNNTTEGSDADFMEVYNGNLIIGDIYSSTSWSFIQELDLTNLQTVTNTNRLYETNTNFPFTEMAVAGDFIYVYYDSKLYSSSLLSTIQFTEILNLSTFGFNGLPRAMTGFPYSPFSGFSLRADTIICSEDSLLVDVSKYDSFTWNDGSAETQRWISSAGDYYGIAKQGNCSFPSDTFTLTTKTCNKCVEYYEELQYYLQLGRDIEMCYGEFYSIVLPRLIDTVFWMDGTQGRAKHLTETATLSAIVKVDSCVFISDTIQITFVDCDACEVYFPNAFTPNSDEINNTFKPVFNDACNYRFESFTIYNRWGEKLYEDEKGEWNGHYQGELVQQGVYYYIAKIKNLNVGNYQIYSGPIQVLF
ncbi:MAG: hypothetical protein RLZZ337_726, partial [Bacteroidota bacterium]